MNRRLDPCPHGHRGSWQVFSYWCSRCPGDAVTQTTRRYEQIIDKLERVINSLRDELARRDAAIDQIDADTVALGAAVREFVGDTNADATGGPPAPPRHLSVVRDDASPAPTKEEHA